MFGFFKKRYDTYVIHSIARLSRERIRKAQEQGWELNGPMTVHICKQGNEWHYQPIKRKIK